MFNVGYSAKTKYSQVSALSLSLGCTAETSHYCYQRPSVLALCPMRQQDPETYHPALANLRVSQIQ